MHRKLRRLMMRGKVRIRRVVSQACCSTRIQVKSSLTLTSYRKTSMIQLTTGSLSEIIQTQQTPESKRSQTATWKSC